jgi:hypothetical protein
MKQEGSIENYMRVTSRSGMVLLLFCTLFSISCSRSADFNQVDRIEERAAEPSLAARIESDIVAYAPPDLESLRYFGRGLTREQSEALQQSRKVLILDFAYSKALGPLRVHSMHDGCDTCSVCGLKLTEFAPN